MIHFEYRGQKGNRPMNWDQVEGEWKQRRGKAMHHWGKVMNDDLAAIAGKYEEFVGRLQQKYGVATAEANRQVKEFRETIGRLKKSNDRLMKLQKSLHAKHSVSKRQSGTRSATRTASRKTIQSRSAR